ncbi:CysS/YqeB C-terminal domain-containing protein [Thermocatellispora tengchongensis]|uniref:CysS/YqeB C-terminal domain-containing protein n=1 Tax=Thermocatellispora tengchongensis TaxID=1073253 RepID=UPI00362CA4B2
MSEARQAPRHVIGLAEQRATARRNRDFAAADVLRGEIEEAGWLVRDTDDGFELTPSRPSRSGPRSRHCPSRRSRIGRPGIGRRRIGQARIGRPGIGRLRIGRPRGPLRTGRRRRRPRAARGTPRAPRR